MHPAFSVIFLTTLIGAGQGLFLALHSSQVGIWMGFAPDAAPSELYVWGSFLALVLMGGGLLASFFHLGHPERAWRTAASWRTSWLSREVIVLPLMMMTVFCYGAVVYIGFDVQSSPFTSVTYISLGVGSVGVVVCLLLFLCTAMIYACLRFLQEWSTPLTVINFALMGTASGFTVAAALSYSLAPAMTPFFVLAASGWTLTALISRGASLRRNSRIKHKSTPQSAIGVRHPNIRQLAEGAMGGSFNTREFFHGRSPADMRLVKWMFLILVFPLPVLLLAVGFASELGALLAVAVGVQMLGLILERWYFFADATHPQNHYYQRT